MSRTLFARKQRRTPVKALIASGGIQSLLEQTGRMPPVSLIIQPLSGAKRITLDRFLTYRFTSSILVPVDTFDFNFVAPDSETPLDDTIKDGDIVQVLASGEPLATGIIDITDVETDKEFGEKGSISGRDLMSQFEDHDAISIDDTPVWGNNMTVDQVVRKLSENTRISKYETQLAPKQPYLFATEPGESKLAALQRYLEPLNCLAWMGPNGSLIIGRPNMAQKSKGTIICSKTRRESNVISIKATRNSTSIPNIILPIWSGQESVQERVPKEQRLLNASRGPSRLRNNGHRVPKCVVVSTPQGASAQELSGVNQFTAGGSNLLQAYAKREIARQNIKELIVQALVPGHYNERGEPYQADQVYKIEYDRGKVDENMYLYQVDYELTEDRGQTTRLHFCRLGRIVSGVVAP